MRCLLILVQRVQIARAFMVPICIAFVDIEVVVGDSAGTTIEGVWVPAFAGMTFVGTGSACQ